MRKEFDPGKAAALRSGMSKTPLDDSSQKAAAGVVAHQHRITCVSKPVACLEVEHPPHRRSIGRFIFQIHSNSKGTKYRE
jgi:hypothetical protein